MMRVFQEAARQSSAFLILLGVIVFAPLIDGGTTQLPILIIRLVLLAAGTVWVFSRMRSGTVMLYQTHLLQLVAVFLGWAVLSLCWSPYTNASLQWLVSLTMYAVFFVIVVQGIDSLVDVRGLVVVLLGMGLVEGLIGLTQYVWLGEARARGTFFNPNFFATYEAVVLVLSLGLVAFADFHGLAWKEQVFIGTVAGIASLAFLSAQSRGAALALIAVILIMGIYRLGRVAIVGLALVIGCVVVIPNPLAQRFRDAPVQEPYAYTRFDIWKNSLQRVADRPWGVGLGAYKYSSFQYQFPTNTDIVRYEKRAETAHNEYLQIAVELGVGGLVLFLIGIWGWGREVIRFLEEDLGPWERGVAVGLSGGVLVILFHAAVDSVFHEPALLFLLLLAGGLVLVLRRLRVASVASWRTILFPPRPLRIMVCGLCLTLMLVLTIQPALAWYLRQRGNDEVVQGHVDQALRWHGYAALVDPGTTAHHDTVALLLLQQYQRSGNGAWLIQAIEEMEICVALNSMDGRFPSRLGSLYSMLADAAKSNEQREVLIQEAVASFEMAIERSPFTAMNYLELGRIRFKQGRFEQARAYARRGIDLEPNFLPARILLAEASLRLGDDHEAASELTTIQAVRARYRDRSLNNLETQFLEVDVGHLQQVLKGRVVS